MVEVDTKNGHNDVSNNPSSLSAKRHGDEQKL